MSYLSTRFWVEAGLALFSSLLLMLTLVWPEWLELVLRIDPDDGNGAAERAVVTLCALVALAAVALARVDWQRARATTAGVGDQ